MAHSIDLNADLGESFGSWTLGDDRSMLALVSSANVACGFHAGDGSVMLATCAAAAEHSVAVGAHVAYRDLAGFGRRVMLIEPHELAADVLYQLSALAGIARVAGTRVSYVKPHGALYNRIVDDEVQARAVADAVASFDDSLPVLGLPGSAIERAAADAGLPFRREAFLDRAYDPDGSLVPRTRPGAVLHDVDEIVRRALGIVHDGRITAVDGTTVAASFDSMCVHGDTPGAAAIAAAVRTALDEAGVAVRPFVEVTGA